MESMSTKKEDNTDRNSSAVSSRREFISRNFPLATTAILASPLLGTAEKVSSVNIQDHKESEQFITNQVNKIKEIINNRKYNEILSNPYLVYCFYYLQSFLDQISEPKNQHDIPEKIIGSVAHLITSPFRAQTILYIAEQTREQESLRNKKVSTNESLPLKKFVFGKGKNHNNAIDLFADELSPVYSMASGLVLVAENGWHSNNESSSSSTKGGNTVIVFNYVTKKFYRYAHLDKVTVNTGELVMEGQSLGTVGHTGNASRPGHGHHLHFEIHQYRIDENTNQTLLENDLKKLLRDLKHTA